VIRAVSRSPQSVELTQVRGTLRGFSQRFTLESDDEGTVLTCRVEADPGIPMVSDEAARHFLTQYVERMLDRLRLAAERRAPSRRPRPVAKEAADAGEAEAADAAADESTGVTEAAEAGHEPVDAAADGVGSEPPASPEPAARPAHAPRRPQRPFPPRRQRPQRPGSPQPPRSTQPAPDAGAPAAEAAPSDQAGAADAAAGGQGRRRRRKRRRRGRGTGGSGPAGGAPDAGPAEHP